MLKTLILILCFFLVSNGWTQQLIGVGSEGVYEIDPVSGATNHRLTFGGMGGATDSSEDNLIYARTSLLNILLLVDLDNWSYLSVGSMQSQIKELAYDEARQVLFGVGGHDIYRISPTAAASFIAHLVSVSPGTTLFTLKGLDYDIVRDTLVGTDEINLWEINKENGECTVIGPHSFPGLEDIYCDPVSGRYWAVSGPVSELLEISPDTGSVIGVVLLDEGPFTGIASYGNRDSSVHFCIAASNSTGEPARTLIYGHGFVFTGSLLVATVGLPIGQPSILIASQAWSFIPPSGNTMGYQCVIGNLAVFRNQLAFTPFNGRVFLELDLSNFPTRPVSTSVQVGETWYFQSWYRDRTALGHTTNFSLPSEVVFQ